MKGWGGLRHEPLLVVDVSMLQLARLDDLRESNIRELGMPVRAEHNVLGLQVPVNDVLAVNECGSCSGLNRIEFRLLVVELPGLAQGCSPPMTTSMTMQAQYSSLVKPSMHGGRHDK